MKPVVSGLPISNPPLFRSENDEGERAPEIEMEPLLLADAAAEANDDVFVFNNGEAALAELASEEAAAAAAAAARPLSVAGSGPAAYAVRPLISKRPSTTPIVSTTLSLVSCRQFSGGAPGSSDERPPAVETTCCVAPIDMASARRAAGFLLLLFPPAVEEAL